MESDSDPNHKCIDSEENDMPPSACFIHLHKVSTLIFVEEYNNLHRTTNIHTHICINYTCVSMGEHDLHSTSRMAHIIAVELEILYAALGCVSCKSFD